MKALKLRWLLPVAHAIIDCFLLVSLITYSGRVYRHDSSSRPGEFVHVALLQDGGSLEWDPIYDVSPPGPFLAIMSANLPAALVSDFLRPRDGVVTRNRRWDPVWFLIQEAVAFPCWYAMGIWADRSRKIKIMMIAYLAVRCIVPLTGFYDVVWKVQSFFWLASGFVLAVSVLSRLAMRGLAKFANLRRS